jgi:hypothetical protein
VEKYGIELSLSEGLRLDRLFSCRVEDDGSKVGETSFSEDM